MDNVKGSCEAISVQRHCYILSGNDAAETGDVRLLEVKFIAQRHDPVPSHDTIDEFGRDVESVLAPVSMRNADRKHICVVKRLQRSKSRTEQRCRQIWSRTGQLHYLMQMDGNRGILPWECARLENQIVRAFRS